MNSSSFKTPAKRPPVPVRHQLCLIPRKEGLVNCRVNVRLPTHRIPRRDAARHVPFKAARQRLGTVPLRISERWRPHVVNTNVNAVYSRVSAFAHSTRSPYSRRSLSRSPFGLLLCFLQLYHLAPRNTFASTLSTSIASAPLSSSTYDPARWTNEQSATGPQLLNALNVDSDKTSERLHFPSHAHFEAQIPQVLQPSPRPKPSMQSRTTCLGLHSISLPVFIVLPADLVPSTFFLLTLTFRSMSEPPDPNLSTAKRRS